VKFVADGLYRKNAEHGSFVGDWFFLALGFLLFSSLPLKGLDWRILTTGFSQWLTTNLVASPLVGDNH